MNANKSAQAGEDGVMAEQTVEMAREGTGAWYRQAAGQRGPLQASERGGPPWRLIVCAFCGSQPERNAAGAHWLCPCRDTRPTFTLVRVAAVREVE